MEERCPYCDSLLVDGKCPDCGYYDKSKVVEPKPTKEYTVKINVSEKRTSRSSKTIALVLCCFFGCLGAHYFYVGRVGKGILYLFTGGLFAIGWIIDIIKIAEGNFRDEFGDYLE